MEDFLLRRAASRGTITYRELVDGEATSGSPALRTTRDPQLQLSLPPPVPRPAKTPGKPRTKRSRQPPHERSRKADV